MRRLPRRRCFVKYLNRSTIVIDFEATHFLDTHRASMARLFLQIPEPRQCHAGYATRIHFTLLPAHTEVYDTSCFLPGHTFAAPARRLMITAASLLFLMGHKMTRRSSLEDMMARPQTTLRTAAPQAH